MRRLVTGIAIALVGAIAIVLVLARVTAIQVDQISPI